jgi:hypothetical protein
MNLTLHPGVLEDMKEFTEVFQEAFRDDPVYPNFMREVPYEERIAWFAEMLRKDLQNPWVRDFKIVDSETR